MENICTVCSPPCLSFRAQSAHPPSLHLFLPALCSVYRLSGLSLHCPSLGHRYISVRKRWLRESARVPLSCGLWSLHVEERDILFLPFLHLVFPLHFWLPLEKTRALVPPEPRGGKDGARVRQPRWYLVPRAARVAGRSLAAGLLTWNWVCFPGLRLFLVWGIFLCVCGVFSYF